MSRIVGTRSPGEREDGEAERLVRPAPKKKPPRHDRRREDMRADQDDDPDLQSKDRSLNYKTIGGSVADRVVLRYAVKGDRIPARSKETGKVVFISEKSLQERPDKYEKWKPKGEDPPSAAGAAAPEGKPDKPKPPRPRPKPPAPPTEDKPAAAEKPAEKPPEPAISGDAPPPQEESERESVDDSADHDSEDDSDDSDEGGPEKRKPKPEPPVAEKLGIPAPQRREASAAEHDEVSLMLADHLPPELAAELIASGIHPDDAKQLISSYRAAKSRPTGSLSEFASKAAEIYETDPDRVQPPKTWRSADGKKVAFEALSPDEKATAYRQHQMQVVAMSLAAQHQIEEKLTFDGTVTPAVSKLMTRSLLGKLKDTAVPQLSEKVFDVTAGAKTFLKISDGSAKKMLDAVQHNEGARSVLQSYLQANDYKRAKDLYLNNKISERDKPKKIIEGLRGARDFFKVQGRAYGNDGHDGAKRFETKTLAQLRDLDPEKYKVVRRALDEDDVKEYRKAKRQYVRDLDDYKRAHTAWQEDPFAGVEPKAPEEPQEPIGASNAKESGELADEGRQLWKDLQERSTTTKTAARVASKFLISSYLSGIPMHRTSNPRAKRALYHGIAPEAHYPRAPYPKWGPIPSRDLADSDYETILASARTWLNAPVSTLGVEGMVPDQKFRQALDLALSSGLYKPDIQAYNDLLARLQGVPAPSFEQSGLLTKRADVERGKLEKAVYASFPPDSKRRAAGKLTVMLTGATASKLRRREFSTVALADLPLPELQVLARTMHLVTSSFDPSPSDTARGPARDFRTSDNGVRQMLRLSTEQKTSANQILASFDQLAKSIQENYSAWGMPKEAAKALVNRLDRTADATEAVFFGEDSLRARQAEVALSSESFIKDALEDGLLTRAHVNKAARVIQRDSDESYMDTFKNPMAPLETDSDEPYMSAYGDDQSSAVTEGEDDTGRELAPEA